MTSFRSTGIDDNADALAMTIDASENVLVGKTSAGFDNDGFELTQGGRGAFTRDNAVPLYVNRRNGEGNTIEIREDNDPQLIIGSKFSGRGFISSNTSNNTGIRFDTNFIAPSDATGANRDNAIDLGSSGARFNDIFLGGSIFIGGTSSVNSIDDVETGSWTPNVQKGGSNIASPNSTHAYYIRVGDMCHYTFYWYKTGVTTSGSDQWSVGPVPFDMRAGAASGYQHIHVGYINIAGDRTGNGNHRWQANQATYFFLYGSNLNTNVSNQSVELSGAGVVRLT